MKCDGCGHSLVGRKAYPVLAKLGKPFDENRPIPRSAMTPEQSAAIPWGEHPDDDRFKTVCEDCREAEGE